jgi:hypothetical protein
MALEILDDGSLKARVFLGMALTVVDTRVRAIGLTQVERIGTGVYDLTLLEPIAADEFYAEASVADTVDTSVLLERTSDTVVRVSAFNTAGAAATRDVWVDIYRLAADIAGAVAVGAP